MPPSCSMVQCRAFEFVVAARRALDALNKLGDDLHVWCRDGATGVVHQDVDAAVGGDDVGGATILRRWRGLSPGLCANSR